MFDAIDNSDYNFKYSTDNGSYDDRMINESLNRVTQILIRARDEAKLREKYYEIILESVSTGVIVVDNKGNIYEQWRNYHSNGELSGIYDTNGFKQEFDYRGLPIKE